MQKLVKYSKDIDFKNVKSSGYSGIIFDETVSAEIIRNAKKNRLKTYIYTAPSKLKCRYINKNGLQNGCFYGVSSRKLSAVTGKIGNFDGFLIPIPKYSEVLYNDEIKDIDLLDAFNETARIDFYEKIQNYEFEKHILPLCNIAKEHKKEIIFNFGSLASQYDELKYFISKDVYLKYGIITAVEKDGAVKTDFNTKNKILVIAPIRKIMQNYIFGEKLNKNETALNLALSEIRYFRDSLISKGLGFNAVGDFAVKNIRLGRYEKILICESCIFDDMELYLIKKAENNGVAINDEVLLNELDNMY